MHVCVYVRVCARVMDFTAVTAVAYASTPGKDWVRACAYVNVHECVGLSVYLRVCACMCLFM